MIRRVSARRARSLRSLLAAAAALLETLVLLPGAALAQQGPSAKAGRRPIEIAATMLSITHEHIGSGPVSPRLRGFAVGATGRLRVRWLELDVAYAQGSLHPPGDAAVRRSYVEGSVDVGVRAVPWLLVEAGPDAYEIRAPVQRRIQAWKMGARVDFPILHRWARAFVLLAADVGGNAGPEGSLASGTLTEVGLRATPPGPVWIEASYGIDRDRLGSRGFGSESSDCMEIALGTWIG